MIGIEITSDPISDLQPDDAHTAEGSEIIFHGRVRNLEDNTEISALEYEYYPGMAEKKLNQLAQKAIQKFGITSLFCTHRIGVVPVGEISVRIVIWSGHRTEGLQAMDWFIVELKKDVPIWKWGVLKNGEKFPTTNKEESVPRNSNSRETE